MSERILTAGRSGGKEYSENERNERNAKWYNFIRSLYGEENKERKLLDEIKGLQQRKEDLLKYYSDNEKVRQKLAHRRLALQREVNKLWHSLGFFRAI